VSDLYALKGFLEKSGHTEWLPAIDEAIDHAKILSMKEGFVHEIEHAFNEAMRSGKSFSKLPEWQDAIAHLSNTIQRLRYAVKALKRGQP